jgi:nucleoside-diphosphate-sugar epimerase
MRILVTGACGYKGHVLVPMLLEKGYEVIAHDIQWFGNYLPTHKNLVVIKGDVRDTDSIDLRGVNSIIHLSSIANDPCGDLNPKLTWEVSALATMRLADKARRSNVSRFIYASSGSVYGIKSEAQVTEDLELNPISEYNKTKMVSERVLLSYSKDMGVQIVRPATVCGFSKRMRLDVAVNLLTMQALSKGAITVLGGDQVRPNIHIDDICSVYMHLIENPGLSGIFNAGFENISIMDIAKLVSKHIPVSISINPSNDPRSYRLNSSKLLSTGFTPKKKVEDAIKEIVEKFSSGVLSDEDIHYNLKWMEKNSFSQIK